MNKEKSMDTNGGNSDGLHKANHRDRLKREVKDTVFKDFPNKKREKIKHV